MRRPTYLCRHCILLARRRLLKPIRGRPAPSAPAGCSHIADLGPDFPCLDRPGVGLHQRCGLVRRAAHPIIELKIVEHDRHAIVILGDARSSALLRPLSHHRAYDEIAKHTKVSENFAALGNFQPTQYAGACLPQKQAAKDYAGGTERQVLKGGVTTRRIELSRLKNRCVQN